MMKHDEEKEIHEQKEEHPSQWEHLDFKYSQCQSTDINWIEL